MIPKPRRERKAPRPIARKSRPSKVRKTPRGKLRRIADKLWSLTVREAGKCRLCGSVSRLQAAHGFSRRYLGTRWDLRNGFSLCSGCHVRYTHDPLGWDVWLRGELGELYEPLRQKAMHGGAPADYEAIIQYLKGGCR